VDELLKHPLFQDVSAESLALLSPYMEHYFRTGDQILRESDSDRSCIAILEGEVQLFAQGTFLTSRSAGELLGEQAIIDDTKRSATVTAQGMVRLLIVPAHVVDSLMNGLAFVGTWRSLSPQNSGKPRPSALCDFAMKSACLGNSGRMSRQHWRAACSRKVLHTEIRDLRTSLCSWFGSFLKRSFLSNAVGSVCG
jgi:hypothetical protein